MATISFERDLNINTPEELERYIYAMEQAELRGPMEIHDFSEEEAKGKEMIRRGYKAFVEEIERNKQLAASKSKTEEE